MVKRHGLPPWSHRTINGVGRSATAARTGRPRESQVRRAGTEVRAGLSEHRSRLAADLCHGEPDQDEALRVEPVLPNVIPLEVPDSGVELPPVNLGAKPELRPQRIYPVGDPFGGDPLVQGGNGQIGIPHQPPEQALSSGLRASSRLLSHAVPAAQSPTRDRGRIGQVRDRDQTLLYSGKGWEAEGVLIRICRESHHGRARRSHRPPGTSTALDPLRLVNHHPAQLPAQPTSPDGHVDVFAHLRSAQTPAGGRGGVGQDSVGACLSQSRDPAVPIAAHVELGPRVQTRGEADDLSPREGSSQFSSGNPRLHEGLETRHSIESTEDLRKFLSHDPSINAATAAGASGCRDR